MRLATSESRYRILSSYGKLNRCGTYEQRNAIRRILYGVHVKRDNVYSTPAHEARSALRYQNRPLVDRQATNSLEQEVLKENFLQQQNGFKNKGLQKWHLDKSQPRMKGAVTKRSHPIGNRTSKEGASAQLPWTEVHLHKPPFLQKFHTLSQQFEVKHKEKSCSPTKSK